MARQELNNIMRILFILLSFSLLSGCSTLTTAIEDKEFNVWNYDTPNVHHGFGYYNRYDYFGYSVSGNFGDENERYTDLELDLELD